MSCLTRNKALANQQKRTDLSKQNISGSNKITEIINAITIHWFDFFFSIFKIKFEFFFWHYVHKCKQGERHTFIYTSAKIDITQHSWAGRGSGPSSFWAKLKDESSRLRAEEIRQRLSGLQGVSWGWVKRKRRFFTQFNPLPPFLKPPGQITS